MTTMLTHTDLKENMPSGLQSQAKAVETDPIASLEPTPEALRYADVLEIGMRLGLLCLFMTFPFYIFGMMEPRIPVDQTFHCWTLSAAEYNREVGIDPGVGWLAMITYSDFLNFIGITILASVTALCCLAVIPLMLKRHDMLYAVLALLQVLVLVLAASGVCAVGH